MISAVVVFLSAIVISLCCTWPVVWSLKRFAVGQPIRAEGPAAHQLKRGTPTMGGIGFLLAITLLIITLIDFDLHPQFYGLLLLIWAFAGIGLVDDGLKVWRGQNQGLTFWQKIILQVFCAGIFAVGLVFQGNNLLRTDWLAQWGLTNPYLYQALAIFLIVGSANATNLTDGLNGLLAGTAGLAFLAMGCWAYKMGISEAAVFALICSGAVWAFLYFNWPRAQVFMGDVGALALGAALAGLALLLKQELRLAIIGGVFLIEALSVIVQVASYKLWRKRVFKMSPLHHHCELSGLPEGRVVIGFWLLGMILGAVGILW